MSLVTSAKSFEGQSPNQGRSPGVSSNGTAGHSHRLTSGGEAEASLTLSDTAWRAEDSIFLGRPLAWIIIIGQSSRHDSQVLWSMAGKAWF